MAEWINSKYVDLAEHMKDVLTDRGESMANCTNCHGVGSILWTDPKSGKTKSFKCLPCKGSGQV